MRRRALGVALLALGCQTAEPRPQWTVTVATDAALPQLGDRLRVEILAADGTPCRECTRLFALPDASALPLSFGVAAHEGQGAPRVRARLFRADHVGADDEPIGGAWLDAMGQLPELPGPVLLSLSLACFGMPSDVAERRTCVDGAIVAEPVLAPGDPPEPGSWPGLEDTPCTEEAPPEMVCIPGGAFVLGHPFTLASPTSSSIALPERLTVLPPFFLDRDEVSVGQVRALYLDGAIAELPALRDADPLGVDRGCTFAGIDSAENDALPANCITAALAEAICAARGLRLPTEAEWEFAAGSRRETPYPWGYDSDICGRAVVARGRELEAPGTDESTVCRFQGETFLPWGPLPGGSDADVTEHGVKNLAGNVAEITADVFAPYSDRCWTPGERSFLHAPRCDDSSLLPPRRSLRGGSWTGSPLLAGPAERGSLLGYDVGAGVRCARSSGG